MYDGWIWITGGFHTLMWRSNALMYIGYGDGYGDGITSSVNATCKLYCPLSASSGIATAIVNSISSSGPSSADDGVMVIQSSSNVYSLYG